MSRRLIVSAGALVVALLVLGALLMTGVLGARNQHPPCEQLSAPEDVDAAIAEHPQLVQRLEALGDDVQVARLDACQDPDRAMIGIFYSEDDQADRIDEAMSSDGFGVPAQPVKGQP